MTSYTYILTEVQSRVGVVRLNRPKALNALNSTLNSELMGVLEEFDANPDIGAMLLTGDERAFAAGSDIKEMADASAVEMLLKDTISLFDRFRHIKKPVIANTRSRFEPARYPFRFVPVMITPPLHPGAGLRARSCAARRP